MRNKTFILVAALVALLIVGVVAAYAYDSSHDDEIANGVTVAGLDVGGLTAAQARTKVEREVSAPLQKPVTVRWSEKRFTLSARAAGLKADVGGMVDEALAASRDGNIVGRVVRDLTGGEEKDAQIPAEVSYSRTAVARLVGRVRKAVDRPAKDATLDFPSLRQVKEQDGFEVRTSVLQRRVRRALTSPEFREATVSTRVTKPKVTRDQLEQKYPNLVVIERGGFRLKHYRKLKLVKSYTIAVGQVGLETPAGLYRVQNKAVNPAWSVPNSAWAGSMAGQVVPGGTPQNPLKARWLGIADGAGIHGTDQVGSLGTAASHGCIRMAIPEVIELYNKVGVGTPVYVA